MSTVIKPEEDDAQNHNAELLGFEVSTNQSVSLSNLNALLKQIPVGRFCEPEEFAHCVRFFLSPLSGFITGEILDLNGGLQFD